LASPIAGAVRAPWWRRLKWAAALGGLAYLATTTLSLATSPAYTVGNANFRGVLVAGHPGGFPISPRAYDLSHGAVTLHFRVPVRNVTNRRRTFTFNFSVHHIISLDGVNIADGQPGQPGVGFTSSKGTTQVLMPGITPFTMTWRPKQVRWVTRHYVLSTCGYFQIDVAGHRIPLAFGFTRALGCPTGAVRGITTPSTGVLPGLPEVGAGIASFVLGGRLIALSVRRSHVGRNVRRLAWGYHSETFAADRPARARAVDT